MTTPQHVDHLENQSYKDLNVVNVDTWITKKRFQHNYGLCNIGGQASSKEDLPLQWNIAIHLRYSNSGKQDKSNPSNSPMSQ
jgi:hypothetical protein